MKKRKRHISSKMDMYRLLRDYKRLYHNEGIREDAKYFSLIENEGQLKIKNRNLFVKIMNLSFRKTIRKTISLFM